MQFTGVQTVSESNNQSKCCFDSLLSTSLLPKLCNLLNLLGLLFISLILYTFKISNKRAGRRKRDLVWENSQGFPYKKAKYEDYNHLLLIILEQSEQKPSRKAFSEQ